MYHTPDAFADLLQRARAGDPESQEEIVHTYSPPLLGAISLKLKEFTNLQRLRSAEDFAQEVWMRFFGWPWQHPVGWLFKKEFASHGALRSFLVHAGRSRVLSLVCQYLRGGKRDLRGDRPLDAVADQELVSSEPGPERIAAERDEWEQLQRSLPEPICVVVRLFGEGWTVAAVADELGLSARTIARIRDHAAHGQYPLPVERN
jgi:DNA-directed RNA polymerase specialized sigma24 family protein